MEFWNCLDAASEMSDYEENGVAGDGFHSEDGGVRRGEIDDHRDSKSEVSIFYLRIAH